MWIEIKGEQTSNYHWHRYYIYVHCFYLPPPSLYINQPDGLRQVSNSRGRITDSQAVNISTPPHLPVYRYISTYHVDILGFNMHATLDERNYASWFTRHL